MSKTDKTKDLTNREAQHQEHKNIIDLYFLNGYKGAEAVREFRPDITPGTARVIWSTIAKSDKGRAYINNKRQKLRASAVVAGEQILNELLTFAYSDATTYLGLAPEEIKQLPADVRRCIQSIKIHERETTDRNNNTIKEIKTEIRLVDKLAAIDKINKHIGFYSEDNKQKAPTVNIQQIIQNATPEETKSLINILKAIKQG